MKNTMKKILCSLLVVVLCLTSAPLSGFVGLELPEFSVSEWFASKASAASEGYYTYTITDGEATITDVNSSISGDVVIPSTLGGYSVTTIGDKAFCFCDSLTSITIPDRVTTIGDEAFACCYSLTSVTIPDSVTTIGDYAFAGCYSLTSVTIPDSVTTIGDSAFRGCDSLTSVTIPDSVTTIGDDAFAGCTSLTSVTIPDSVTNIGGWAFSSCDSLTSVTIPDSVTTIGELAFYSCDSLTSIVVDINNSAYSNDSRGVLFNKNKTILIQYPEGNTGTSYTIPDSVTTIGDSAFRGCDSLASVTIPDSVTSIGHFAFSNCTSLESILIPYSVTGIGDRAFGFCTNIKNITVDEDNNYFSSDENGVLFNKDKNCLILYPVGNARTSYIVPDSVLSISHNAFAGCSNLESVTILDSVTSINGAFESCYSLKSVTLSNNLTSIGDAAFDNCYNLTSITIPDSVTSIGFGAFRDCTNLESITIPDSVTLIGNYAFICCERLESITIPDSVKLIGEAAFAFCTSLENITIPEGVPSISLKMFDRCTSLESVTIPDSITSIDSGAFALCTSLENVTIPNSVTSIGDAAFYGLNHIGYEGTQEQWNKISLGKDVVNESAYLHFEFDPETVITEVITIPATCIKEGAISKVCSCGYVYKDGVEVLPIEPNAHLCNDEYIITKAPTCCEEGEKAVFCLLCGVKDEKSVTKIEKLAHSFSEWIVEENKSTRYCFNCGYTETKFNTDDGDVEIEYPETPDTDFEVDEIIPTDDNYIIVDEAIGDNVNVVKAFDINLKNKDGVHVQPDGTVKVKLPLDWEKEGNYKVYRVNDDGTLTDMNAYRQGSHMVFDTDHFSIYVIVHQHTYKSTIIPPSCTEQGYTTYTCECGDTYSETIEPTGHDFEGSKCKNCDYDKADDCSCNCHKGGISGFFFKLILFFQKIFKTNKTCSCGVAHY